MQSYTSLVQNKISIAVLPFTNISTTTDNDFFCDGITEEIINALAQIAQLKVTSRTSSFYFKDHPTTIKQIGEMLDVATILEGSVRISGKALRINAQLINVKEDTPFWSENWNRTLDNIFEVQDEISLLIADKLREQYGHLDIAEHLVVQPTSDLSAYQYCLQAKYYVNQWNPKAVNKAIVFFEQAVKQDPLLIDGWLGIADAYGFLATTGFAPWEASWQKSQEAIQKAQAIDSQNAPLNYQLANYAFFTEANYAQAFKYTQQAIESKPTHPEAQQFMAFLYMLVGNLAKSKEHLQYAKAIDPLNPETRFYEAYLLYRSNQPAEALKIYDDLLANNPQNLPALISKCYAQLKLEQYDSVIKTISSQDYDLLIMPDEKLGLKTLTRAMKEGEQNIQEELASMIKNSELNKSQQADTYLFLLYIVMGKNDLAFELLQKVFTHKSSILLLNFGDPLAQNIRQDPRYPLLHKKIYPPIKVTKKKSPTAKLDEETIQKYLNQLTTFIKQEQPYLNPALSLRLLANQLEISPNQLSWLLNNQVGENFNVFINKFRVDYFKKLVIDPRNSHISLIGLAYESGFNSKTVFNTYFKKLEGITPKQYQKEYS